MIALIVVIFLTLGVSAVCSLFEATLYSTRTTVLEASKKDESLHDRATRFIAMKRDISRPTSAILILNTIANTAGATLAGTFAAKELGPKAIPVLSVGLTLSILFMSEILPKTYGAVHWRGLWSKIASPLYWLQIILTPAVLVTQRFAAMFTPKSKVPGAGITTDEIIAMIRLGNMAGEVSASEQRLIGAIFDFEKLNVRQVMLPRSDIAYLKESMSLDEVLDVVNQTGHTRFPLVRDSLDDISGLVHVKDLIREPDEHWTTVARPVEFVPDRTPLPKLLRRMQRLRQHMTMVVDEHGRVVGLITLENILEQIVGAVQDEFDELEPVVETEAPGRYLIPGALSLSRVSRELGIALEHDQVDSLSGLIVSKLGRVLEAGDMVEWDGYRAEVLAAAKGRATRVRLTVESRLED